VSSTEEISNVTIRTSPNSGGQDNVVDSTSAGTALRLHADAIRELGKRTVEHIIEIGHHLTEAQKIAGHGNWLPWLDREFGWKEDTARRFMRVFELSKSRKLLDLNVPVSALYLLAAPSTPEKARDAVLERAEAGGPVSVADVKATIATSKMAADDDATANQRAAAADRIKALLKHRNELESELESETNAACGDHHQDGGRDHEVPRQNTVTTARLSPSIEIHHFAVRLAERDAKIARELYDILWADERNADPLVGALALGIEEESDDGAAAETPVAQVAPPTTGRLIQAFKRRLAWPWNAASKVEQQQLIEYLIDQLEDEHAAVRLSAKFADQIGGASPAKLMLPATQPADPHPLDIPDHLRRNAQNKLPT
jgi:hypothetical protein